MSDIELQELPPPSADDTYGTLKTRKKTVSTTGRGRPAKGLVQINLKLAPETRSTLIETCDKSIAAKKHATRNDVITEMLAVYGQHGDGFTKPVPTNSDRSEKRTLAETVFFVPGLFEQLKRVSADRDMTLSGFIQRLIQRGLDYNKLASETEALRARVAELETQVESMSK
jgi:hypothetical protein